MYKLFSHSLFSFLFLVGGYYYFIVPVFGYTGFQWNFSYIKFLESLLFILFFEKILPRRCSRPSDFILNIHFLLPILPMFVLYACSNRSRIFMYAVLFCFYMIIILRNTSFFNIRLRKINQNFLMNILILICLIYVLLLFNYQGFNLNFNFFDIYMYREIYSGNLPRIFNYASPLVSKVFLPAAVFLCITYRQKLAILILIISSTLIFGYTQHKGTFFYPLFVIVLYNIIKSEKAIEQLKTSYLLLLITCMLFFYFENTISQFIASVFFRRALFVPAELNFQYFEYFSISKNVFWANNFFTFGLVDYPYDLPTANIMGEYVSNKATNYANTGWIGSGFMHFHFIGLLIYTIIISIIMSILDTISKQLDTRLIIALTVIPILTMFVSSDLPTTLITHGLLFSIIIILYISPIKFKNYE
ncbi:MAG: hypothetical protein CMG24_02810 [Candidatus Marinimicrobia bacterium]|nr:hypothetical protein [Candidatus Neomarinimicrobiota bacterium]|tara:strand:+ start:1501 stop:2751 length:1251 start_codon:yes stop_codon:yes gene_type:complete